MDLIADILLAAGAMGAGFYCFMLGRRLKRFNSLETGVGGAVAVLSAQVDDLTKTLEAAQKTAAESAETVNETTQRATEMARRLELQMAALHDLQEPTRTDSTASDSQKSGEPIFTRRTLGGR